MHLEMIARFLSRRMGNKVDWESRLAPKIGTCRKTVSEEESSSTTLVRDTFIVFCIRSMSTCQTQMAGDHW